MPGAEPIVRFADISKTYDGRTYIVQTLNLAVERGEFLTLLGPSGSGKTTTLMMLAGFERPTTGEVFLNGVPITAQPPEKRGIGMVFQNYALFPHLTVGENVAFPLGIRRMRKDEIARRVAAALAMVRLEAFADRRPMQLSGGQQQRVALARALVFEPAIVLLDEPLGALDRQLREQMQVELKLLHDRLGITMIYVTHDQIEALTMSDRVAVFAEGGLRQIADPRTLYDQPDNLFVAQFLGESNVLRGVIVDCDGSACLVEIDGGVRISAVKVNDLAPGSRVNVVLRPERVRTGAAVRDCENRLPATAIGTTFTGDQLRCRWSVPGCDDFLIKLKTDEDAVVPSPGFTAEIGWRTRDCRALVA